MALNKNMQLNLKKYHMALPLPYLKYIALSGKANMLK